MNVFRRTWGWINDRTGIPGPLIEVLRHPVPPGIGWPRVLGSATLAVFILQMLTGTALAVVYVPSTEAVYDTLVFITEETPLGRLIRGMHYFGASAMVVLVTLHAIRVFVSGNYKYPREMNWLTGSVLIILTFMMAFTGQLLRWDNHSIWSTMIAIRHVDHAPIIGDWLATFILAGDQINAPTLSRAFAFHVFFFPATIIAFIGLHLFLLVRNGSSEPADKAIPAEPETYRAEYENLVEREGFPFWPFAMWRDAVFALAVFATIVTLALVFGPPLADLSGDPSVPIPKPRPDWYFLWYYALFAVMPPDVEDVAIVLVPFLTTVFLFSLPFIAGRGTRHPLKRPWIIGVTIFGVALFFALQEVGRRAPWAPDLTVEPLEVEVIGASEGPVFEGAILFHQNRCLSCHEIAGSGGGPGPDLTHAASELTQGEMARVILNGAPGMPTYGPLLTDEQVNL
ncbi:MAG TPA: cytochrome b N-terminal domain-containing protein, partial [Thermomicrobiales bacterium]|nr:cytochrome b N-terminal domain-containing protein [Thermomicrobiales bacterium]